MTRALVGLAIGLAVALAGCSCNDASAPAPPPGPKPAKANAARIERCDAALRKGVGSLLSRQLDDGSFAKVAPVGMTGLALSAILSTPEAETLRAHAAVKRAAAYVVASQQANGSLNPGDERKLANYQTAAALSALAKLTDPAHKQAIEAAKKYLLTLQRSDGHSNGGWGYNSSQRADLSNTQMALDALRAAGLDETSDAFKNCRVFLQRCHNRSESNDMESSGDDGGAMYYPGNSKAGTVTLPNGKVVQVSYGSMTYALLRGYILVGLKPDDPRVVAAQNWLGEHYSVDENPGMKQQGLFYYYMSMAEALHLLGSPELKLPDGTAHPWARDLADKLLALQRDDGTWVNEAEERWFEGNPVLATSYALLALSRCRDLLAN